MVKFGQNYQTLAFGMQAGSKSLLTSRTMPDYDIALLEIQKTLAREGAGSHQAFLGVMVPGQQRVYGVKTPVLNELARKFRTGSFELAEALWASGSLEERVIAVKILEKTGKSDPGRLLRLFQVFSKGVDNWAVCDGLGMQSLRSIVKTHEEEIFSIAEKLVRSKNPWQRRLSLVMVEWYTRKPGQHRRIRTLVSQLKDDEAYYVQKAIAWISRNFDKQK